MRHATTAFASPRPASGIDRLDPIAMGPTGFASGHRQAAASKRILHSRAHRGGEEDYEGGHSQTVRISRAARARANQRPEGASACSAYFVNGQPLLAAVR
jgi:hypothetical protein